MDWTQAFTVIGVIGAFLIYVLSKMDSNQKETNNRLNSLENSVTAMRSDINNTNQRITDLKTDINQRLSTLESYIIPRKVVHIDEHQNLNKANEG